MLAVLPPAPPSPCRARRRCREPRWFLRSQPRMPPLGVSSLIDIPALETRSRVQNFVSGELEHLSADRLPLRIWAQLTGLSALTNDEIDGQNKEEHTKKHFCLVWCVRKPSSRGC